MHIYIGLDQMGILGKESVFHKDSLLLVYYCQTYGRPF